MRLVSLYIGTSSTRYVYMCEATGLKSWSLCVQVSSKAALVSAVDVLPCVYSGLDIWCLVCLIIPEFSISIHWYTTQPAKLRW